MEEEFIVKGAMATCQFGVAPAMLNNIMDNMNVYFNGKLAATSMTMGPVFPSPAFGTCNMVPNMPKPCVAMITKWDNVYSDMYINRISHPLTQKSKGTCALGCPMCISFQTSGQIPIPTVPIMEMSAFEHQSDMNLLAIDDLEEEEIEEEEDELNSSPISDSIKKLRQFDLDPNIDTSHVNENVKSKLMNQGLTNEDISRLIDLNRRACDTNNSDYDDMREVCREISDVCFPLPKVGDTVTKLITPDQFKAYHLNSKNRSYISNCIGKADEYSENPSLSDLIIDFGLDYGDVDSNGKRTSPFTNGYVKIFVKIKTEEQQSIMTKPFSAMNNPGPPQTKTGILGHEKANKLTPEYHTANNKINLDDGDYACIYDNNGNLVEKYQYICISDGDEYSGEDELTYKWEKVNI